MDWLLTIATGLYLIGTIFIVLFVMGFGVLLIIYLRYRQDVPKRPQVEDSQLLSVTIQLPIYNEAHVVERLIDACVNLDYPVDKLFIQILDDSIDHTSNIIEDKLCTLSKQGVQNITHIQRCRRDGYKAGALAFGLKQVTTDCVVIFDADFVPQPNFLRETMPFFNDNPRLALLQTRWSHINRKTNWLTRAQALSIDAHFAVEQVARSRGRLPMAMNGTGGIWRVPAIHDAGGWSSATLTEDMDLSYRAFLRGWQFLFLVDVDVPGELPPLVQAYKTQQARWATGSTQCLLRHSGSLITNHHFSTLEKMMGLLHLAQYIVQPVILMLFLLMPILLLNDGFASMPDLTIVPIVGFIPPLIVALGQMELHHHWWRNLLDFPMQFMTAVAIVLTNSIAVLKAIVDQKEHEFKRTPKFQLTQKKSNVWRKSHYKMPVDVITAGELLLAFYASFGLAIAMSTMPMYAPYMLTYAISFSTFALWNIYQSAFK
jgi:cellulose synthase/poly-beta-1,6-N-acetylglucosamine synthase-like glycosyltransferase